MTRFSTFVALLLFVFLPTLAAANLYRMGNYESTKVRDQDWEIQGDHVHASNTKGLSLNTNHPYPNGQAEKTKGSQKKTVSTLDPHALDNHQLFAFKHDGGTPGHGPGHVSLTYKGTEPIHKDQLLGQIKGLPWQKHDVYIPKKEKKARRAYMAGYRRGLEQGRSRR
jgi:hypothetical protein